MVEEKKSKSMSNKGIIKLKEWEGCKLEPYDDQTGKEIYKWCKGATIGVGHLIPKSVWHLYNTVITEGYAIELLKEDIKKFEKAVIDKVIVDLKQHEFDALCILAFNIGITGFKKSTVLKMINDPEYKSNSYKNLKEAWKAWNKSQGKVMRGLINRRNKEWKLYTGGHNE